MTKHEEKLLFDHFFFILGKERSLQEAKFGKYEDKT